MKHETVGNDQLTTEGKAAPDVSAWNCLPLVRRRLVVSLLFIGYVQFILLIAYLAALELGPSAQEIGGAIEYPPLLASFTVLAATISASVFIVNHHSSKVQDYDLFLLGSSWALASVALTFDFLVDSFPPKLAIAILFVYVGVSYWKGNRNSSLGFALAPLIALIAAGDGWAHLAGSFCSGGGLDSCSAKAISDVYLVMILLALTYFTLSSRSTRPSRLLVLGTILLPVIVVAASVFFP